MKHLKKLMNYLIKKIIIITVRCGIAWPLVYICSRVIKEVTPLDNLNREERTNENKRITLLALTAERFRSDLEILASGFCVLTIPFDWQCKILSLFFPDKFTKKSIFSRHCDTEKDRSIAKRQEGLRLFLRTFLKSFYRRMSIDCVIGSCVYYQHDYDWGLVSKDLGVPYIVLHRENLMSASPKDREEFSSFLTTVCKEFRGSYIVVHNPIIKDLMVKTGYVSSDKISSLGCLRMDNYVCKVKKSKMKINKRKKVVLFSFTYTVGFGRQKSFIDHEIGLTNMFQHVHVSFAKLANQMKDVDFVIKLKWGGNWISAIEYHLKKNDIDHQSIENLEIIDNADAQKLILESDVVCGFNSTALLEAAISGIKVVVPCFDEALNPEYLNYIRFKEDFDALDVAHSIEEFEKLIIDGLKNPKRVDEGLLRKRYALFEKYVSGMDGNALDKYVNVINQVIKEGKCV